MLKVHFGKEVFFERAGEWFDMHIVAVASSLAAAIKVLLAFGIAEVSDRGVMSDDLAPIIEAPIDIFHSIFGKLLR